VLEATQLVMVNKISFNPGIEFFYKKQVNPSDFDVHFYDNAGYTYTTRQLLITREVQPE